ncbi:MAG: hypothetical protein V3V06_04410, partial [Dehalococcoidia bacterium]
MPEPKDPHEPPDPVSAPPCGYAETTADGGVRLSYDRLRDGRPTRVIIPSHPLSAEVMRTI